MRRGKFATQMMGLGVWAAVATARAQAPEPVRVERSAGAQTCPDAAELSARVERIRGQAPAADASYFVQFAREGRVYSAVLRSGADGSSLRSLESPAADCAALAQATAVTLALLFDADDGRQRPEPAPEVAPAPIAPEPQPSAAAVEPPPFRPQARRSLGLTLGAGLLQGVLRPWAPALLGEVAFVQSELRVGLGAWWAPDYASKLGPGSIELGLVAASARVCYAAFRRPWLQLDGCSGFVLGSISAAASGYTRQDQAKHVLFAALPLEVALGQTSEHASWQLSAALLIPLRRNQFGIDGIGPVYATPALAALLAVRVGGWIDL